MAVERLAIGLTEAGHEVLLVVGSDGEPLRRFKKAGIRCEFVAQRFTDKLRWLQYCESRRKLVEILRREKPDIVHSNDLPTHQMTSDAARRVRIPRVCHHRWVFDCAATNWFNKYGAERHLFVSRYLMDELCRDSQKLRSSQGRVVYDGLSIPPAPSNADKVASRKKLGMPQDRAVVLFAGQIIERKGVKDLLQSWVQLGARWCDIAELVIVGDDVENNGIYREKMESFAADLNCRVRFAGFQKNVGEWLTAADIAIVPSHAEPLGNATLEAMGQALPVIGTRVGGIPEMIIHEKTGFLVPPRSPKLLAEAIDKLLGNAALRETLGRNGRERCESQFSLQAHVAAIVAEYKGLLNQHLLGVG